MQLIDRRDFMKAAGTAFAATLAPERLLAIERTDAVFATCYQVKGEGPAGVAVLSEDRRVLYTAPLADRGHDVSFDPVTRRSVVFARRPDGATIFWHPTTPLPGSRPPGAGARSVSFILTPASVGARPCRT